MNAASDQLKYAMSSSSWRLGYVILVLVTGVWTQDLPHGTLHQANEEHALDNHVIETMVIDSEVKCMLECIHDKHCRSVNYGQRSSSWICEKNDADKFSAPSDYRHRAGFVHYAIMNPVMMENKRPKPVEKPALNVTTNSTDPVKPVYFASCKEILDNGKSHGNGVYTLTVEVNNMFVQVEAYCHMTSISSSCGGGGWTLVMKTDGRKSTFKYSSSYWTDKNWYNPIGGQSGFDNVETKLPTYWMTSFTNICLGMKVSSSTRWIQLSYTASSLYNVIATGHTHSTNIGRSTWKSLIAGSSLQSYCNWEGFNVGPAGYAQARIGIVANQETNCNSPDTRIGFGLAGSTCDTDASNTCGNEASYFGDYFKPCLPDNGNQHVKAFGYILVQ